MSDDDEGLTLRVDHGPTVETGDELLIFPDVGDAYTATVREIAADAERVRVALPSDGRPGSGGSRWFDREELEDAVACGDLLINPDEGDPADPEPAPDGGRYGPHEQARDARIARRRVGRRL